MGRVLRFDHWSHHRFGNTYWSLHLFDQQRYEIIKEKLNNLNERINIFINDTVDDARSIKILEKPDLFREHLVQKIHNSRNVEFNKLYKAQIKSLLSNKVKTIFELAEIFNNINIVIADEHISSLDFWRYKLYQVLMDEVRDKR